MGWTEIVAWTLAGGAITLHLLRVSWHRNPVSSADAEVPSGASPQPSEGEGVAAADELAVRLAAHGRRSRERRNRWRAALAAGIVVLTATLALDHFTRPASDDGRDPPPAAPSRAGEGTIVDPPPSRPPDGSDVAPALWPLATLGMVMIVVGGAILIFGPTRATRVVGAVSLLSGLTANGYLIKEVKFDQLFKLEVPIDGLTLELELNKRLGELSSFGPKEVARLRDFGSGKDDVVDAMSAEVTKVCNWWSSLRGDRSRSLLLVVGSTDRVPLKAAARRRYESNVGLATARAERTKASVVSQCQIPEDQILTLASGPRHTPLLVDPDGDDAPRARDRSVVIWALWNVPTQARR
jgi:hypothetical protein